MTHKTPSHQLKKILHCKKCIQAESIIINGEEIHNPKWRCADCPYYNEISTKQLSSSID